MKRQFTVLVLVFCMLLPLPACAAPKSTTNARSGQNPYYPENEIITIEDLNDGRMVIVVDTQYNISTTNIEQVIEKKFPEVNVVLRLQNTPDSAYQTQKSLEYNLLGDIFFCITGLTKDESILSKYFMELSDTSFISHYYQNALDSVAVNGKIYMLPGFSDIFGIIYDRTVFEEQGWELPKSRDEFISLCTTIEETIGFQAFMPAIRYPRMVMLLSHAFHYDSVIAGTENQKWVQAYRKGNASFSGHMEPMFAGMKEFFDAGVLSDENFKIEAGVRSSMLYKEHTATMTMETQNAANYAANAKSDHEYGMMPFWNGNTEDSDYVVTSPGFNIYVNKNLEEQGNIQKLEKVLEILEYFSTPEGQQALMNEETITISNVKGTDSIGGGEFIEGIADTIAKGNIFQEVRYTNLPNNNSFQEAFQKALRGYLDGTMNMEEAMKHCDSAMQMLNRKEKTKETVYGVAKENFTVLETAEYVADILRERADADVALVLAKQLTYGETGNFFEGDITDTVLNFVTLDYVSGRDESYNKLVTVNLTGEQILAILNYPYLNNAASSNPSVWVKNNAPSYWVPSNFKLEYAPLLPKNSILSVKNMDGSDFDLKKTYKTAVWSGCFSNLEERDYFDTDTLAAMEAATPVSEESSIELIKKALEKQREISPPNDGRFTIRWDVTIENK